MIRNNELRPALYHRLHRLLPLTVGVWARRFWRTLVWLLLLIYFGFVALVLLLRYSILPNIENYRGDIEQAVSRGVGLAVSIGRIEASWEGINPDLSLFDVRVADAQGRPALAFSHVETILSWWSVPTRQLRLRLLRIDQPTLHLRREVDGSIFVAGIPLGHGDSESSDASGWVLAQKRIRIRGATVVWDDVQRAAPSLTLQEVDFGLDNDGRSHRFGLTALPPEALASKIDVRGDFRGRDIERLESWKGQLYAEIDYADLAVWRRWIDYPVALPHGRGALRAWVGFAHGTLNDLTADVSLQDVNLQLSPRLPTLQLDSMAGRLSARWGSDGLHLTGRQIELATRAVDQVKGADAPAVPAIQLAPSDFQVDWQNESGSQKVNGRATANFVDLKALASLANYLPLDAHTRQLLLDFAPQGIISQLRASWRGDSERLETYSLQAGFEGLGLRARGYFPGFSALSGGIEASEKGGRVHLDSRQTGLDLPSVFPESLIALDTLRAEAKWVLEHGKIDAELLHAEFAGPEAAGSAQGRYRFTGEGPGEVDMTAALSRADARAVWRYMPHVVSAKARLWLRDALLAGASTEAKLILQGDLRHFPFLDRKKGQFLVTVKARDVTLDYGVGWPKITGIDGDLRFEGAGMLVEAQRGAILGAQIAKTRAEIPDFDVAVPLLKVKGQVEGPTGEFLRYIEQSPVGARIDHFTEGMRANGNGRLDLGLVIPLSSTRLGESKVDGSYRFINNEVTVDADLPPLRQVNGVLQFSEKDLRIPEIAANLFGGPLKIKGSSQEGGRVLITARGTLAIVPLRAQFDLPLLDRLSGSTDYEGEVRVQKRSAEVTLRSSLLGLSSSLPQPFNKIAGETLRLNLSKTFLAPLPAHEGSEAQPRDQIMLSLGDRAALQVIRNRQGDHFVIERGALAIGRPLRLPESGMVLGVTARQIDVDDWRRLLHSAAKSTAAGLAAGGSSSSASRLPVTAVEMKLDEAILLGRHYTGIQLSARSRPDLWQIRLISDELTGDIQWETNGRGKLKARLAHLQLDPTSSSSGNEEPAGDSVDELPALDIVADDFAVGKRRFGRLEVQAHNEARLWKLDRVLLSNPHGKLSGSGQWQLFGGKRTQLDFTMESEDSGKLLDRLGYAGALRGGGAQLKGTIGWQGSPVDLHYPTLSGEMSVEVGKGQFLKLDPGAGKLLSLISLQSLPRRITLDFRDVFSEGFAFDTIAGKLQLKNGLMRTERLQIDGSAAKIVIRGHADLAHETQELKVNVLPEIGGTAALGVAAFINPVAGVATLLAHRILQNPLNQMFGFDYLITGTWDDPKVEKLSRTVPPVTSIPPSVPTNPPGVADE